mmetsp:Transcript_12109/g.33341  ORF Transcript_12109/g.33341 Transcript_12109/m.33341 type:complete len:205 (-) Transcript_12109:51-665(-)
MDGIHASVKVRGHIETPNATAMPSDINGTTNAKTTDIKIHKRHIHVCTLNVGRWLPPESQSATISVLLYSSINAALRCAAWRQPTPFVKVNFFLNLERDWSNLTTDTCGRYVAPDQVLLHAFASVHRRPEIISNFVPRKVPHVQGEVLESMLRWDCLFVQCSKGCASDDGMIEPSRVWVSVSVCVGLNEHENKAQSRCVSKMLS